MAALKTDRKYQMVDFKGNMNMVQYHPHCLCCKLIISVDAGYTDFVYYLHKPRVGSMQLLCYFGSDKNDYTAMSPPNVASLFNEYKTDVIAQTFLREMGRRGILGAYNTLVGA